MNAQGRWDVQRASQVRDLWDSLSAKVECGIGHAISPEEGGYFWLACYPLGANKVRVPTRAVLWEIVREDLG